MQSQTDRILGRQAIDIDVLATETGLANANFLANRMNRQKEREEAYELHRMSHKVKSVSGGGARERARRAKRFA